MCSTSSNVIMWFVCKLCRRSFPEISDFLQHKKEHHFLEFKNTKCIIFEESTFLNDDSYAHHQDYGSVLHASASTHSFAQDHSIIMRKSSEINETFRRSTYHHHPGDNNDDGSDSVNDLLISDQQLASLSNNNNGNRNRNFQSVAGAGVGPGPGPGPGLDTRLLQNNIKRRRKHRCQSCPKEFNQKKDLKIHGESHKKKEEQRRAFACHVCDKSFYYAYLLNLHLKSHSDERPFPCPESNCEKAFKLKFHLDQHLLTHTNSIRPFSCSFPLCSKTFKYQSNIEAHLRNHTGVRPFKCEETNCGKTFTTSGFLSTHRKRVHCSRRLTSSII